MTKANVSSFFESNLNVINSELVMVNEICDEIILFDTNYGDLTYSLTVT